MIRPPVGGHYHHVLYAEPDIWSAPVRLVSTCSCLPPVWYLSVCRASYLAIVADDDDHASGAGGHRAGQVLVIFLQPHPGSLEAELEPHVTEQSNHRKHVRQKHNRVSFTHQNHTLLNRATTKPHVTNQNHNTEQHVTNQNHKTEQHVTNQNHNTEHLHTTEPLLRHEPIPSDVFVLPSNICFCIVLWF